MICILAFIFFYLLNESICYNINIYHIIRYLITSISHEFCFFFFVHLYTFNHSFLLISLVFLTNKFNITNQFIPFFFTFYMFNLFLILVFLFFFIRFMSWLFLQNLYLFWYKHVSLLKYFFPFSFIYFLFTYNHIHTTQHINWNKNCEKFSFFYFYVWFSPFLLWFFPFFFISCIFIILITQVIINTKKINFTFKRKLKIVLCCRLLFFIYFYISFRVNWTLFDYCKISLEFN